MERCQSFAKQPPREEEVASAPNARLHCRGEGGDRSEGEAAYCESTRTSTVYMLWDDHTGQNWY
jgi:hypothetical protein